MILFWHKLKEGEESRRLLEAALPAYCDAIGKKRPRKKNRGVAEGEHGKPYYPALPSVFVSVSHSRGYWVALFDNHPCGVDVEETTRSRVSEAVIRRKFTPEEQALFGDAFASGGLAGAETHADEATFLRVWTRKEAYLKYTGEGLTRDTLSFSVAGTDADGRPCFREDAVPFYGEPRAFLGEIDFSAVTDADGGPLPLIGAFCGTYGDLAILPLPEKTPEDARAEANEIALDYLETRMWTAKEVRARLREKGVPAERADETVAYLKEYGFLDDGSYAALYAEDSVRKGRGPLRIERDLAQKGIDRETARRALAPYRSGRAEDGEYAIPADDASPDGEAGETTDRFSACTDGEAPTFRDTAEALARKTYEAAGSPPELDDKLAAKILRKLASRGFSAADSYAALDEVRRLIREKD